MRSLCSVFFPFWALATAELEAELTSQPQRVGCSQSSASPSGSTLLITAGQPAIAVAGKEYGATWCGSWCGVWLLACDVSTPNFSASGLCYRLDLSALRLSAHLSENWRSITEQNRKQRNLHVSFHFFSSIATQLTMHTAIESLELYSQSSYFT